MLLSHHPYPFSQTLGLSEFQGKREVYHEGTVFWKCTPNEDDTPTSHNAHDHTWSRITSQRKCCNSGWWGGGGGSGYVGCMLKKEREKSNTSDHGSSELDRCEEHQIQKAWLEGRTWFTRVTLLPVWHVWNTNVIMSLSAWGLSLAPFEYKVNCRFLNRAYKNSVNCPVPTLLDSSFTILSKTVSSGHTKTPAVSQTSYVLYCFSRLEHPVSSACNALLSSLPGNSYWHLKSSFPTLH